MPAEPGDEMRVALCATLRRKFHRHGSKPFFDGNDFKKKMTLQVAHLTGSRVEKPEYLFCRNE
jgi:hypothetical protein